MLSQEQNQDINQEINIEDFEVSGHLLLVSGRRPRIVGPACPQFPLVQSVQCILCVHCVYSIQYTVGRSSINTRDKFLTGPVWIIVT